MKELPHHYGPQVHLVESVALGYWLAQLGHPDTRSTDLPYLIRQLYSGLLLHALDREFPTQLDTVDTRMTAAHPEQKLSLPIFSRDLKAVTVNLARAGTMPSQICYETLGHLLDPDQVRQDHILAARIKELEADKIQGAELSAAKIGGSAKNAIVVLPDPMGATGYTLCEAVDYYKDHVGGPVAKFLALHLIVTPEYLKRVTTHHPDVVIYGLRLDRGLSPAHVLADTPGKHWDLERGLNDMDYVLPGAGGLGEVLNNSWV